MSDTPANENGQDQVEAPTRLGRGKSRSFADLATSGSLELVQAKRLKEAKKHASRLARLRTQIAVVENEAAADEAACKLALASLAQAATNAVGVEDTPNAE